MRNSADTTNIALVAHQYWPVPGPATLRLDKLVEQLVQVLDECHVRVLTTSDPTTGERSLIGTHGEEIIRLQAPDATGQSIRRIFLLVWFGMEAFWKIMRMRSIDLVVCDPPPISGLAAIKAANRRRAVSVYYFCDSWASISRRGGLARRVAVLIRAIEDACLRQADVVLAAESALEHEAIRRGATNVVLAENGANIELVSSLTTTEVRRPTPDRPYFVYAGTHSDVHGARVFIKAAQILWSADVDFEICFVGAGTDAPWIREQSSLSGGRLTHRDPVPLADLIPIVQGAVASLVSLGDVPEDYYATPSKIYTSLAAGCPILYSGVRGPAAFIDDENLGWLVQQEPEAVSRAMLECLGQAGDSGSSAAALAHRCRVYARTHRDFSANLQNAARTIAAELASNCKE